MSRSSHWKGRRKGKEFLLSTVDSAPSHAVFVVVSTAALYVHQSSMVSMKGSGGSAMCIHCKATNQPLGMPEFLHCTGKFVVVVTMLKVFTMRKVNTYRKNRNSTRTYGILRYTGHFIVEALDCVPVVISTFNWVHKVFEDMASKCHRH